MDLEELALKSTQERIDFIKELKAEKGYTYGEIASAIGVHRNTISNAFQDNGPVLNDVLKFLKDAPKSEDVTPKFKANFIRYYKLAK
jgi:transcriptional regulator with XRE-family HTH domain